VIAAGPIVGSVIYTAQPVIVPTLSAIDTLKKFEPVFTFDISGQIPLYTFGKITNGRRAAEANVRVTEWDFEKLRQQTRMDVRRAFYGLMFARDARYLASEVKEKLDKAMAGIEERLAKGDTAVDVTDKLRLEMQRKELQARSGEADRGETFAIASLRFLTGVQTAFDIPDEPLKRPERPLAPVVRYLTAARLFRPEIMMARAGIAARQAQVDLARSFMFPDIGLGLQGSYAVAPSATMNNPFLFGLNHFYVAGGFGVNWSLDLLPKAARVSQAEAQLEEVRALERYALGGLSVEVENAYASAVEARQREEAWDGAEHTARQWILTVQDAIDLGTKDEKSLTEPLRNYVSARVSHLQALVDVNITMSELARVSGWDNAAPEG
jgi:outer membrane protein TolC